MEQTTARELLAQGRDLARQGLTREAAERFQAAVDQADAFAAAAHEGQTDRAGRPYITHPRTVASFVEDPLEKMVALLHDTVEDTDTTVETLRERFGEEVAQAVDTLTHRKEEDYFTYVSRISAHPLARRVKLADLRHNMDLSRLPQVTHEDLTRVEKYKRARDMLTDTENS